MSRLSDLWWLDTSSTRPSSSNVFFMVGNGRHRTYTPTNIQRTSVLLSYNQLLLKMGKNGSLKEVKISDVIKFNKHLVVYRFGVPRLIIHDNWPQFIGRAFNAINSGFKVYPKQHTIQLPTALQKLSTRSSKNFSRSSYQKINVTRTRS